jgi:hypothetical protein
MKNILLCTEKSSNNFFGRQLRFMKLSAVEILDRSDSSTFGNVILELVIFPLAS